MTAAPTKGRPGSAPPLRTVSSDEVAEHTGLVHMKIGELQRGHKIASDLEYDDLYAVGLLAVWEALRRWRPDRGAKSTYISSYVWGYVMHYQRTVTRAVGYSRQAGERTATVLSYDFEIEPGVPMLALLEAPDDTAEAGEHAARVSQLRTAAERMRGLDGAIASNMLKGEPESRAEILLRFGVSTHSFNKARARVRRRFMQVDQGYVPARAA